MSNNSIRLTVIQDAACRATADVPVWFGRAAAAALSSDPVTLEDLRHAVARYVHGAVPWRMEPWPSPSESVGGTDLLIDLESRQIGCSHRELVPDHGTIPLVRDGEPTDTRLVFHRDAHWRVVSSAARLRDARSSRMAAAPRRSVFRDVLYDRLLDAIAETGPADASELHAWHRRWLLTPRDDLDGRSPREVLLMGSRHVSVDIEDQQQNWARTGRPAVGLDTNGAAYRGAFFGPLEVMLYHRMTRILLHHACEPSIISLHPVPRLAALMRRQAAWFVERSERMRGSSPQWLIEQERRRLPLVEPTASLQDCECPLCRMMAGEGPSFWFLDLPPLDGDYLYSLCRTEEEWALERDWYDADADWPPEEPDWYVTTFVAASLGDARLHAALFRLGTAVAEFADSARQQPTGAACAARLNELFDEVHRRLKSEERAAVRRSLQQMVSIAAAASGKEKALEPPARGLDEAVEELESLIRSERG